MKKLFVLILIIFLGSPVFAEYVPIPEYLSKQYKKEVMKILNIQYPVAVQETEQLRAEAHDMYIKVLKDKNLYMEYATNNFDMNIYIGEFHLLSKIIDITDKYVDIKNDNAFATDYTGAMLDFLNPYFKDNGINQNKLKKLGSLITKRYKEIIKEQEILHKFMYPDEY